MVAKMNGKTLVLQTPFEHVVASNLSPSSRLVEDLLSLRPCKQNAAIQRANRKIDLDTSSSLPIPVVFNFEPLTSDSSFATNLGYVAIIDELSDLSRKILTSTGKGHKWGSPTLVEFAKGNASIMELLKMYKKIEVTVDPTNKTKQHYGNSSTLVPECFLVTVVNQVIVIRINLSLAVGGKQLPGAARAIQFVVDSSNAFREEENLIREIVSDYERQESDHRRQETERIQNKNIDKQKDYRREMERYDRDMQNYHKELAERCYSCSGKRTKKCGICNGRGWNENNKKVSNCSSCHGKGELQCSNCDGTGLKHSRGVNQPRMPNPPVDERLPVFGSMPDFRSRV